MQRIQLFCAVSAVVLMTVGGNYFSHEGGAARRQLLAGAVQSINKLPEQIGPWNLEATEPFSARTIQMLQVAGYTIRSYVHAETGEHVTLTLMVGAAGPLVAHSPEVCLASRDYEMISAAQPHRITPPSSQSANVSRVSFRARTVRAEMFDVYYAWSRNGRDWEVPEYPRVALGGSPMLFKLQISAPAPLDTDDPQSSISQRFLRDLLPILQRQLYTPAASPKL